MKYVTQVQNKALRQRTRRCICSGRFKTELFSSHFSNLLFDDLVQCYEKFVSMKI